MTATLGKDTAARLSAHADLVFRRPAHESVPVCPGEGQLALNTLRLLDEVTNDSNFRQVPRVTNAHCPVVTVDDHHTALKTLLGSRLLISAK